MSESNEIKRKRPTFTTTIDEGIQNEFRKQCKANRHKMSDVLEAFMNAYNSGKFVVESKVTYELKKK